MPDAQDPFPLNIANAFSVRGQVVIVTGAAGWIGGKIAEAFAVNGAVVISSDLADAVLDESVKSLIANGYTAHAVPADLTRPADLQALVTRAVEVGSGRLDALVHCGAIPFSHGLMEDAFEDFDRVYHTNVRSAWLLARACVPHMTKRGGSIVNIASVNAHRPTFPGTLYTSSKAALLNMTQEIAVECAPDRIRANTISPGPVPNVEQNLAYCAELLHTQYRQGFVDAVAGVISERGSAMQPLPVGARPFDVAMAAIYLASPASRLITGADILVDGGYLLSFPGHAPDPFWDRVRKHLDTLPDEMWLKPRPNWLKRTPK